ncbi:27300_t:CDS:2, partial [Gigaspora margarita]
MVKTNYYNSLNPAVLQALINLQYRYGNETPEMWCSHIHYPFRTLLENNPKYFSKNGFIYMTERSRDRRFTVEKRSFYIYCTICDTLVFLCENIIECANHHLNECIAKTAKRHFAHSNPIQKKGGRNVSSLSSDERGYRVYNTENEFRKKIAYFLFNGAKIIQQAWRAFKLRPETWAKRVWNM